MNKETCLCAKPISSLIACSHHLTHKIQAKSFGSILINPSDKLISLTLANSVSRMFANYDAGINIL